MTHTNTEGLSDLLPCPFCGDQMNLDHGTLKHSEQGKCVIGAYAWDGKFIAAWNRRAANSAGRVEVKDRMTLEKAELLKLCWSVGDQLFKAKAALEALCAQTETLLSVDDDMPTAQQDCDDTEKAVQNARAVLLELDTPSPAVEAEPVAEPFGWWISDNASEAYMTFERDEHTRRTRMNMRHGDWTETALYTHPSSSVSAEVTERWAKLLAAYDAARENQKDNGPDINLIIIGNYGDLAIQELRAALSALNGGRENG